MRTDVAGEKGDAQTGAVVRHRPVTYDERMVDLDLDKLQRIGQGRAAEVFALDAGRVIKIARDGAADLIDREATAMRAAHAAGMPVPAVHDLVVVNGRRALIMSRARGKDMLSGFAARPWTIMRAGAKLGRLHARLHETIAPAGLPSVKDIVEQRLRASGCVPVVARDKVIALLRILPDGNRLCHLDFHPGNVMVDHAGMTVIDWPGAGCGDPIADVALTIMGLQGGKSPPGTPLFTRLLEPIGRKLIFRGYLRAYCKRRAIDQDLLTNWLVVAAGQRLTYAIEGEQQLLLRVIERDGR